MKTYKVIYTENNKPGRKVIIVEADNESMARLNAERDLMGSWGNWNCPYTFWEVTEVK